MKASKILLNIVTVFCFIYFALYIFSLVFIPIGIYCFLAGKRFAYRADNPDDINTVPNNVFRNYVVFVSIFVFPFGLLSIIPYYLLTSNRITVTDLNSASETAESTTQDSESAETAQVSEQPQSEDTETEGSTPAETTSLAEVSEEEKLEKFKKLEKFREKGLITDEELEQAREQLFGKKQN